MKKIIFFLAVFACTFLSCKKSNSSASNYHFTATVDGKAMTFNVNPIAIKVTNSGISLIAIEGFAGNAASNQNMSLSWNNSAAGSAAFIAGTYTDANPAYVIMGVYEPSPSEQYVGGTELSGIALGGGVAVTNHLKVVITATDDNTVKGTFSGDLYLNSDPSSPKKTITAGDFYVPWKK